VLEKKYRSSLVNNGGRQTAGRSSGQASDRRKGASVTMRLKIDKAGEGMLDVVHWLPDEMSSMS
jgi:hypothetical protein